MEVEEIVRILEDMNQWRQGFDVDEDGYHNDMPHSPRKFTMAIEMVLEIFKTLEPRENPMSGDWYSGSSYCDCENWR